jgi:OOP family OmpA-OmpF porin
MFICREDLEYPLFGVVVGLLLTPSLCLGEALPASGYYQQGTSLEGLEHDTGDLVLDVPAGMGFPVYLAREYRLLAKHQENFNHFQEMNKFLDRASAVEEGQTVEPEPIGKRTLRPSAIGPLASARDRLMRALTNNARERAPRLSARAQAAFDCWMEEEEEHFQPQDIDFCRRRFEEAMVRLELLLLEAKPAPCPGIPTPCPAREEKLETLIYFAFDRADLSPDEQEKIMRFSVAAKGNTFPISLTAHADRAGSESYNLALSRRRMEAVLAALEQNDIPRSRVVARHLGELFPKVPTPDGMREPQNRRVELKLITSGGPR